MIPPEPQWELTRKLLEVLLGELMPKLKEVLSLRGIRLNDMESFEAHASGIFIACRSVLEVYGVGREVIEQLKGVGASTLNDREQRVKDLMSCHRVVSARLTELLTPAARVPARSRGAHRRREDRHREPPRPDARQGPRGVPSEDEPSRPKDPLSGLRPEWVDR